MGDIANRSRDTTTKWAEMRESCLVVGACWPQASRTRCSACLELQLRYETHPFFDNQTPAILQGGLICTGKKVLPIPISGFERRECSDMQLFFRPYTWIFIIPNPLARGYMPWQSGVSW